MLPLSTARLTLRPLVPEDAQAIANLVGNWNVARWLARVPFPYTLADAEAFIVDTMARDDDRGGTVAAIVREAQPIGIVSIESRGPGPVLGFWLGEAQWGNGYMSEASRALVAAFFAHTRAPGLHSGYLEGSAASARIHDKLGFEVTGRGTLPSRANGRDMPDIDLYLTRERFSELHPRISKL